MSDLVAVVLAAGAGTRLRPVSVHRPKPLCPVDGVALVDHAIGRARTVTDTIAVNLHHGRAAMEAHLRTQPDVRRSFEPDQARGTAGALGRLRRWIDGRDALVLNADTWCPGSLAPFATGWDRERVRVLGHGGDDFGPGIGIAAALMPWSEIAPLSEGPSGLFEVSWRRAHERARLETVRHRGPFVDCATPADYLRANLASANGESVIDEAAVVEGVVERSVLWPGAVVRKGEVLRDAIRLDELTTVLVRTEPLRDGGGGETPPA